MNEAIYEKNLALLKIKYKEIYDVIIDYEKNEEKVYIDESVEGETIFAVKTDNHMYYLNSRYQDETYSEIWVNQFKDIKYQEVVFVFGLSNFRCAKKLVGKVQNNAVLLFEPEIEIFMKALQNVDITDVLNAENIIICVKDANDKFLEEFLLFMIDYSNIRLISFCCMLNYEKVYERECKELMNAIKARCESLVALRNTDIRYSAEFVKNDLANCGDMIEQYSLNQLRDCFWQQDLVKQIPVIIVSAGPSLNKNIEDIKLAQGRAFIIAVDTALRPLFNHGIKPDLVVTVDPHKPMMLFAHKEFYDIPLVECATSNSKIRYLHNGKRFFFYCGYPYMRYLYEEYRKDEFQCLETGGSVANNAFSLAQVLGFKKIILVGQDLAYPDNMGHAKEAYLGMEKTIDVTKEEYFEVEDVYGNKVYTDGSMKIYKIWFENQLVRYPDLQVIDATEGGAKIKGTQIMTLKEAVNKECKMDIEKGFMENIEKTFNEEETALLRQEMDGLSKRLERIKKDLKTGIRKYEKLEELFRKNKVATKEFRNVMEEIDEIIKIIDNEPVMGFISVYNKSDEYEVLSHVNDIKDELKAEMKDIINKGKTMLSSYIKSISTFEENCLNKVSKDLYDNLYERILRRNAEIEESISKKDKIKLYQAIKGLCGLTVDIIDIQYRMGTEGYVKTIEVLKNVMDAYNNKEYLKMLELIQGEMMKYIKEPCDYLKYEV